jgi:hypothetical protein
MLCGIVIACTNTVVFTVSFVSCIDFGGVCIFCLSICERAVQEETFSAVTSAQELPHNKIRLYKRMSPE